MGGSDSGGAVFQTGAHVEAGTRPPQRRWWRHTRPLRQCQSPDALIWGGGGNSGDPDKCCSLCSTAAHTRRDSHWKCGRVSRNCICHRGIKTSSSNVFEKSSLWARGWNTWGASSARWKVGFYRAVARVWIGSCIVTVLSKLQKA